MGGILTYLARLFVSPLAFAFNPGILSCVTTPGLAAFGYFYSRPLLCQFLRQRLKKRETLQLLSRGSLHSGPAGSHVPSVHTLVASYSIFTA